jgi:hypothetical protein
LPDPRLAELQAVGLPTHWQRVAEQIGVDAFLLTWQLLDEADSVRDDCGRVHIPSFAGWIRHQRNLMIVAWARKGLEAREIQKRLVDSLGYDLSVRYIKKLMRGPE